MRFLQTLAEGDLFRVAHPKQVSMNMSPMPRSTVYKVTKVYPQSPYTTIAVNFSLNEPGKIYSLGPRTPVLLPKEVDPTEDAVLKFIGAKPRKTVVGYIVRWDGEVSLLSVSLKAQAAIKALYVHGKVRYTPEEVDTVMKISFKKFYTRPGRVIDTSVVFLACRLQLILAGFLEEIRDFAPACAAIRAANLQETRR